MKMKTITVAYPIHSDEELKKYICLALDKKQQLLAHCNGDAAAEQYVSMFEQGWKRAKRKRHLSCSYGSCTTCKKRPIKENMADIGMIPSFFVAHTYYWGDIHLKNFGEERGESHFTGKRCGRFKNEIYISSGYSGCFRRSNMMRTISAAGNRVSKTGQSIGKNQCVSVSGCAGKAVTSYAAYQYSEENEKGTIEEGKSMRILLF